MEIKTIWIIFHLLGTAIGMGGAFSADYIFFQSISDRKITNQEMSFIKNSSKMVWLGLLILLISGLGLFFLDPTKYLHSDKFITKMIIVFIIALNGVFFHIAHIPCLQKCLNQDLKNNKLFNKRKNLFILSGVISVVSWLSALVLGTLRSIPYTIIEALSAYVVFVVIGFFVAKYLGDRYFM